MDNESYAILKETYKEERIDSDNNLSIILSERQRLVSLDCFYLAVLSVLVAVVAISIQIILSTRQATKETSLIVVSIIVFGSFLVFLFCGRWFSTTEDTVTIINSRSENYSELKCGKGHSLLPLSVGMAGFLVIYNWLPGAMYILFPNLEVVLGNSSLVEVSFFSAIYILILLFGVKFYS